MIIKSLHIEGFGHFHDLQLGEFSKGLYLIYGKNEAGKSTLMDFIRMTLFGYERRHENRRPPLKGGNHGGHIRFEDSSGRPWQIYRSGTRRQDDFTLLNLTTNASTDNDPRYKNIISHASNDLFNNIYAIGLEELFAFESIGKSGMKDQIYSLGLGLGAMNIGEFEKELMDNAEKWYKVRGRTNTSNQLSKELEELEKQLAASSKLVETYDELHLGLKQKNERRNQLQAELDELKKASAKTQALNNAYPDYINYKDSSEKLQLFHGLTEITDALIEKERDLNNQKSNAENESRALKTEIAELKSKHEQIEVNADLLSQPDKLEFFRSRTELLSNLLDSKAELELSVKRSEKMMEDTLLEMGDGYSLEKVLNFRTTMDLEAEAKKHSELLRSLNTKMDRLQFSGDERKMELGAKHQQLILLKEKITKTDSDLDQLQKDLAKAESDFSVALKESSQSSSLPLIAKLALLFLSLFLIVFGVILWQENFTIAISGLLLGCIGLLLFFTIFFKNSTPDNKDLPALQLSINQLKDHLNKLSEDHKNAEGLEKDIAALTAEIKSLEGAQQNVEQEKNEAIQSWDRFTKELGLPKGIDSSSIGQLISNFRRLNELHDTLEEDKEKLAKTKGEIAHFEELVRLLHKKPSDNKNLLVLANELRTSFEVAFEQKRKKDQLQEEIEKAEKRLQTFKNRIEELDLSLADLFKQVKVENREQFFVLLEKTEKKKNLNKTQASARALILSHCGWGELENTIAELDNTDPGRLSEQLNLLERQIAETDQQIKILSEEMGGLRAEMESLEKSADKSGLELKLEEKRTEFQEGYRQWLEYKLAALLVSKCRKKYEETRQPSVIRNTERIFSAITQGRYNSIRVNISNGNMEILEHNKHRKSIDDLSRGTREQLLLSLRMGLIEEYEQGAEPLPVILDDVLVNFDYPRRQETAEQLMNFAHNRQVILFSCHRHMRSLFEDLGAKILEV